MKVQRDTQNHNMSWTARTPHAGRQRRKGALRCTWKRYPRFSEIGESISIHLNPLHRSEKPSLSGQRNRGSGRRDCICWEDMVGHSGTRTLDELIKLIVGLHPWTLCTFSLVILPFRPRFEPRSFNCELYESVLAWNRPLNQHLNRRWTINFDRNYWQASVLCTTKLCLIRKKSKHFLPLLNNEFGSSDHEGWTKLISM